MHRDVEHALEQIDAAVFSSDEFHSKEALSKINGYIASWTRELDRIEEDLDKYGEMEDGS